MAGEVIQYQTEDGVTVIRLQASDGSVWLSWQKAERLSGQLFGLFIAVSELRKAA